jgi:hypothetical protein
MLLMLQEEVVGEDGRDEQGVDVKTEAYLQDSKSPHQEQFKADSSEDSSQYIMRIHLPPVQDRQLSSMRKHLSFNRDSQ